MGFGTTEILVICGISVFLFGHKAFAKWLNISKKDVNELKNGIKNKVKSSIKV